MTWIKVHRKLEDSDVWNGKEPFDRRSAWLDIMLLLASHNEHTIIVNNQPVKLHPGDFVASIRFLMKRWKWGSSKTRAYLVFLDCSKMIHKISTGTGTGASSIYHLVNWDTYQGRDDTGQHRYQHGSSTGPAQVQHETKKGEEGIEGQDDLFSSSGSINIEDSNSYLAAATEKRSRQPDPAYESFTNKFKEHLQIPYQSKRGDFVQLAKLRKRVDCNGNRCPHEWDKAIENYFVSDLPDWTLADLCVRFHVFRANRVNKFGRADVPEEDHWSKQRKRLQIED